MFYLAILLVICLLGSIAFLAWLRKGLPSKQAVDTALREATSLVARKRWEEALSRLKPLINKNVESRRARILYAQILRHTHQPNDALAVIEDALSASPTHLGLQLERGKILLDLQRPQDALNALGICLPVFRSEEDHLDLASALFQTGHHDDAWETVAPLLEGSRNGRTLALAADLLFARKEYAQSLKYYLKAQHCGWKSHRTVSRMGYSLLGGGCIETAEQCFQQILEYDPADIGSTLGLGACLEAKGEFEAALSTYQEGRIWDLGNPRILRQAGYCAVHTRQYRYAEMYLDAAVKGGGGCPRALAFLAYSLECQEKWREAEETYRSLIEKYPDHAAGYLGLTWLFGIGRSATLDSASGLMMAERAVALKPEASSWELLSACEARVGNFTKAHDIQERLSSHSTDATTQQRRRHAMRSLRRRIPLDESLVYRTLVA